MNSKKKLIVIIPIALIILFFSIVTLYIESSYEKNILQDNLMWITPIFFGIIFVLILISFFWSLRYLKELFKKIDKRVWIILLIIFLVGFSLRVFIAPHTHRLYYDEDIYLNIAQNIAREGRTILCNYGTQEKCFEGIYNKQPNGYPFLMSMLFLFGTSEMVAHYATAIISSLIIPFIFLIAYLLFNNQRIGLLSSLFFSLIPISILWAPTTSAGSVSIFFMALTFFAFLSYFKTKKFPVLLFSFASLAYAIQIRPEGLLFLPMVFLAFLLLDKNVFEDFKKKEFLALLVIFSILVVPHMLHTLSVKSEGWGTSGNKLGTEYVEENLKVNGMFFFENTRFPVVFSILSILGLYPFIREWKKKTLLVIWFMAFFVLYLLFYAGSFNYGVDVRFSLNLYIPLAILGGCGTFLVSKNLDRIFRKKYMSVAIVSLIMIIAFMPFYSFVSEIGEKAWDARMGHDFVIEEMRELDDNCWIFTHVPSVVLINGKNSLQAWYAQNSKVRDGVMKNDCVLFYEEYWCNAEPYKSGACKYLHDNFDLKLYTNTSERDKNFTLYWVKEKS
ncbi:MAG: glycosyltransferase family 39 protein [Candidatus Aenigmarchaeota archaeon]|nr:glycosyltransferase family 39 protein [Candidatus Aenigmarchaeota archaeon]